MQTAKAKIAELRGQVDAQRQKTDATIRSIVARVLANFQSRSLNTS